MYSPPYNRVEDRRELVEFMRANSFALLVTAAGGAPTASHLPVTVADGDGGLVIHSHMARPNPQWQEFFDDEVLVVFSGPHAYVSPRWYEATERVPTWNYAAVHAYGKVRVTTDKAAKLEAQRRLVAELDPEWLPRFDALRAEYIAQMLEGIVTFDVAVTRLETRWKLSQNRGRREQELIALELEKSADPSLHALAALTRRHLVER
ncbi:MAG: FMN-binding negative transcriptional regulator [Betaproteobacteria bacterium]|nr:FMN-binding negative transcriptional regulator [Betaproteobacteria bacterium]MDH5350374.1 FMN-binding negative transcriptional regulator [Betaproteobacteria bacterium]